MSRGTPLAAAVPLVLALVGCGSAPLSTSALRARAARTCRLADARAQRIPTPTQTARGVTFLSRGIAVLRPELNALSRLHAGGQADHLYATALGAMERELETLRATVASLRHGGDPVIAVTSLQRQLAPVESQGNTAWETLEIPACVAR